MDTEKEESGLARWWVLDLKGNGRSEEENSEYRELFNNLMSNLGLGDTSALRRSATIAAVKVFIRAR